MPLNFLLCADLIDMYAVLFIYFLLPLFAKVKQDNYNELELYMEV